SCVIGFVFGTLALIGENTGTLPIAIWIILLAVFIYDASFTLIMRFFRRERWYSAHRSHAYQRL
ncbi:MAG: glycosyl transferase family 4, partial [Gammaproteobacteria bacterium]|nr:glycosyl transferase family 4 [Gammaproteobacteria bacterium]NIQ74764.1 glycosyl transferase family 4 [Gammaproteobacteria bacterium]NIR93924.1 glycosyl transferase family 4 [Gammaproteobacteria bacterium]NIV26075.1 glycosyl transferase family 4 [Gammaproteobacteria bacterium]NIW10465.1 glycosyl transferase family 4 [Gammaproteobacteria bacterium]